MYVETVPNRGSPPAILLRESYREDGKVKKRTLANLSDWPSHRVDALRRALRGDAGAEVTGGRAEVVRSRPHGHVAAVLGTLRKLELDRLLASKRSRSRDLCVAMIAARVIDPRSKLATARGLAKATLQHTLAELLGVQDADADELYAALDWLLEAQPRVEKKLAERHLADGCLVLYDLTSTWLEGRSCPLGRIGHARDGKKGQRQVVFGVLADREGRPLAVEVFAGNTADPSTVAVQVEKLRARFGLRRVVVVGDRGMLTEARIREDLATHAGLDWISALRAPAIQELHRKGAIQLSLFEQTDLAEIAHPSFPGERLVVCKNPLLASERARKRDELLAATDALLQKVQAATRRARRPLRGRAQIGLRVGAVLGRYKMGKHYVLQFRDDGFTWRRDDAGIAAEAALDGIYVVRTSVPAEQMAAPEVVDAYKGLAQVERVFRGMKTVELRVRPVFHWSEDRVRAHVFLCMLAYYVGWHMRRALRPLLFDDEHREQARATRTSVVGPAPRSVRAKRKDASRRTDEELPVQSFPSLLRDLATLARNRVRLRPGTPEVDIDTTPTALQARAFELLAVDPRM